MRPPQLGALAPAPDMASRRLSSSSAHVTAVLAPRTQASFQEGYINEADPSVLRFLIASREEVSARQLRDDLLSMLVAGHETTGSVLTWTLYLLEQHPAAMAKARPPISATGLFCSPCEPGRPKPHAPPSATARTPALNFPRNSSKGAGVREPCCMFCEGLKCHPPCCSSQEACTSAKCVSMQQDNPPRHDSLSLGGRSAVWPEQAQEEVDRVLGGDDALPSVAAYGELKYLMRCVNESMRLYPHPPVLLRRAQVADTLPGGLPA